MIACHECGTVHRLPAMPDDTIARCVACGAKIFIRFEGSVERTLALYLAALALFVVANAFPILTMSIGGQTQREHDPGQRQGALRRRHVAAGAGGRPGRHRCSRSPRSWACSRSWSRCSSAGGRPGWSAGFRWVERLQPWAMMEVYLLGVIVAYVKLQDLATVHLGVALYAFVGTIILLAAADARFEPHAIWRRLGPAGAVRRAGPVPGTVLLACEQCDQVVRADAAHLHGLACPRCADPAPPPQARQPEPHLGARR